MKVTCINGSARNDGSCAYLTERFIDGIKSDDTEIVKYCIGDADLHFCKGCKKCYIDGRCVQTDDVQKIVDDILSSDIVVIAAPSYWADVPAQLKTLFDRTTPYGDTNPNRIAIAKKPAKGVAIAVRAGVREQENELILNSIAHYFGHLGIETVRRFSITGTDSLSDLLRDRTNDIAEIAAFAKTLARN